jgi:hypothetical protein
MYRSTDPCEQRFPKAEAGAMTGGCSTMHMSYHFAESGGI